MKQVNDRMKATGVLLPTQLHMAVAKAIGGSALPILVTFVGVTTGKVVHEAIPVDSVPQGLL